MTRAKQARAAELDVGLADLEDMFEYLDRLRKLGETNMYGAAPYLRTKYDFLMLSKTDARKVLKAWMQDFS